MNYKNPYYGSKTIPYLRVFSGQIELHQSTDDTEWPGFYELIKISLLIWCIIIKRLKKKDKQFVFLIKWDDNHVKGSLIIYRGWYGNGFVINWALAKDFSLLVFCLFVSRKIGYFWWWTSDKFCILLALRY